MAQYQITVDSRLLLQLFPVNAQDSGVVGPALAKWEGVDPCHVARMEMVVNGDSARKVSLATGELCGPAFSKSVISALCKRLDPIVTAIDEWIRPGEAADKDSGNNG